MFGGRVWGGSSQTGLVSWVRAESCLCRVLDALVLREEGFSQLSKLCPRFPVLCLAPSVSSTCQCYSGNGELFLPSPGLLWRGWLGCLSVGYL